MKIETLPIRTLRVTEIDKLDPITLSIDDENGKLTIEVYGQAWTAYWSSAKGSVSSFFLSCNNDYLIRCLDRQIRCSVTDFDAIPTYVKKLILRGRRDCDFSAMDAREMYDSLKYESFGSIEHVWRFSLKSIGEDWKHDLPETTSHDWLYLDRIVTAVKEVFTLETSQKMPRNGDQLEWRCVVENIGCKCSTDEFSHSELCLAHYAAFEIWIANGGHEIYESATFSQDEKREHFRKALGLLDVADTAEIIEKKFARIAGESK